jgi:hypothetical protein
MTDRDQTPPGKASVPSPHLEESVLSGRITQAEADVIRSFFASKPAPNWPASDLQRRMQSSGG